MKQVKRVMRRVGEKKDKRRGSINRTIRDLCEVEDVG